MTIPELDSAFWDGRWQEGDTRWDIGHPSPAITEFFTSLTDKNIRILIPGCGNAYEAEWLHRKGFRNVYVVDFAPTALKEFSKRVPDFPGDHLICQDFFALDLPPFDVIVEQTFFCALNPEMRGNYVTKMHSLLKPGGILTGLLFNDPLHTDHPPFGGNPEEYNALFSEKFAVEEMNPCKNSIEPRAGRELWFRLRN